MQKRYGIKYGRKTELHKIVFQYYMFFYSLIEIMEFLDTEFKSTSILRR